MKKYDHKIIEKKWQDFWEKEGTYKVSDDFSLPKKYILDMFPYPSGEGLHVGHPRGYIATDVYSRMKRMEGFNVLHPMGWDAFGLPAENFAIKNKVHPSKAVEQNVARFKEQLSIIGPDYDWSREINTTDPEFYKWTQWMFLQMYKKGLAYQSYEPINWCPECKTGLANEDLESDGTCERCGSVVEKKPMRQWVLKITDYADRLLADLDTLPKWPEGVKEAQRNWIGRSVGSEIEFKIKDSEKSIKIFTTRADTLFGVTYIVLAPEHPLVQDFVLTFESGVTNKSEIEAYLLETKNKSEFDRQQAKEKTGVQVKGIVAINPANGEEVPVWVADYVLAGYGTGAVMAVPAHDERDFEFAKKYELLISEKPLVDKKEIVEKIGGKFVKNYRIKDWVFSRQRYWGEPIPMVFDSAGKVFPVDESQLPVVLPEVTSYEPTGTGESPLATIEDWVNVRGKITEKGTFVEDENGEIFKRETNTMPQWAGSSWYYLRYMDPQNNLSLVDEKKEKYWMGAEDNKQGGGVDVYVGGDHATRHLIYARFWHKFLYDINVVSSLEPFPRLEFLGFILAEDGRKMSKRWKNVINPDDMVERFGADAFRLYEMFIGPFESTVPWNVNGLVGTYRFLERVVNISDSLKESNNEIKIILHKTIKKINEDIENFKFNTAVSSLMVFANEAAKNGVGLEDFKIFLKLLAPFAPHITEELWHELGEEDSIHRSSWPTYDESLLVETEKKIMIQVNGKLRGEINMPVDSDEDLVKTEVLKLESVLKHLENKEIQKTIYVKNKLINFVV